MLTHGEKEGLYYLAMEKVSEVRLVDHLANGDYLPPLEATRLVLDIAYGIKAIHDLGFVHGDLHPTNIAFTDYGQVKLFNILKFRQEKEYLLELVSQRPHYVSPEHIRMETLGFPSDQYTLGIMYFQLLTGRPPYDASDIRDIWRKHMEEDLPTLPMDLCKVEGLDEFIKTLLSKRPKYRYPDDDTLIEALESIEDILAHKEEGVSPHNISSLLFEHVNGPVSPITVDARTKSILATSQKDEVYTNALQKYHGTSRPLISPKINSRDSNDYKTPRNWNRGNAPVSSLLRSKPRVAPTPAKSLWVMSGIAILAIGGLLWLLSNKAKHQKMSSMEPRVIIRTFKEMEAERLGLLEANGSYKKEYLEAQKRKRPALLSSNGTPPSTKVQSAEDQKILETRQQEEKIALIKNCLDKPKNISLPQVEVFLEDPDEKIRFLANQVYRDLKGGTLMTEEDLKKIWTRTTDTIHEPRTVDQWTSILKDFPEKDDPDTLNILKEAVNIEDEQVSQVALKLMATRKVPEFSEILSRQIKLRPWDRSLDAYSDQLKEQQLAEIKEFTLIGDAREVVNLLAFWAKRGSPFTSFLGDLLRKRLDLSLPVTLELAGMGDAGRDLLIKTLKDNPADSICNSIIAALREVELDADSLTRLEELRGKLASENNPYLSALLSSRGRPLANDKSEATEFKVLIAMEDMSKEPSAVDLENIFTQLNQGNQDLDKKIFITFSREGLSGAGFLKQVIGGKFPLELKRLAIDSIIENPSFSTITVLLESACDSESRVELVKDIKSALTKLGPNVLPVLVKNEKLSAINKVEFLLPLLTDSNVSILVELINKSSEVEARRTLQVLLDAYPMAQGCYNVLLHEVVNSKSIQFLLKGLSRYGGDGGLEGTIYLLNHKDSFLSADAYLSLKQRLIGDREEWAKAISVAMDPKIKVKMISQLTMDNPSLFSIVSEHIGCADEMVRKALIDKLNQLKFDPTLPVLNRLILEDNLAIKGELVKYIFSLERPPSLALIWGKDNLSNTAKKKMAPKLTELSENRERIHLLINTLSEPYQLELRLGVVRYLLSIGTDSSEVLFQQLKEGDPNSVKLFQEGMILIGQKATAYLLKKLVVAKSTFMRDEIELVLKRQKIKYQLDPQSGQYIVQ